MYQPYTKNIPEGNQMESLHFLAGFNMESDTHISSESWGNI